MAEGKILEENTPDEFFTNPTHPRLKEFLSKVIKADDGEKEKVEGNEIA